MKSSSEKYIYFDNTATTFPKPKSVINAMTNYLTNIGGNPGRSGHKLSIMSGEIIFDTREIIAELFDVSNPMHIILTSNATEALNLAILGLATEDSHVITTSMEHNSTIRPLKFLEKKGKISLTILPCDKKGRINITDLENNITGKTNMVVINHASNAFGTIQPIKEIGSICNKNNIVLIVDYAQAAGVIPISLKNYHIDLLAFAGHKGLYGPNGTGGLVISDDFDYKKITPLKYGGTGSKSDSITQPDFIPDMFESGTLNISGYSGLLEGIKTITSDEYGLDKIYNHKKTLVEYFIKKASDEINGFINYVSSEFIETGVISFNIKDIEASTVSGLLSDRYDIMTRAGLHCSPLSHKTMNTFPNGTVRFGFGIYNTKKEIDRAVEALKMIAAENG